MDRVRTKALKILSKSQPVEEGEVHHNSKKKLISCKSFWRITIPIGIFAIIIAIVVCCFYSDLAYAYAQWRFNSGDRDGAKKVFLSLGDYYESQDYIIKILYADAYSFKESGEYQSAVELFITLNGYADSTSLLQECYMLMARDYYQNGDYENAEKYFSKIEHTEGVKMACIAWADQLYKDHQYSEAIEKIKPFAGDGEIDTKISLAEYELAYLEAADGSSYAAIVKLNCLNIDERAHEAAAALMCIDPVSAVTLAVSHNHIVYLKTDGSIFADGSNSHGQCDMDKWEGVVSLCASELNTYGLLYNGKVLAAGSNAYGQCLTSDWKSIIALSASDNAVFGLQHDGTVVFAGGNPGQYDAVSEWTHIASISAGKDHIAAVDNSGNTFAAGKNEYGQCNVVGINDICTVSCGPYRTILIDKDGKATVYGVGSDELTNSVSSWTNIIDVSSSYSHIVAQDSMGNLFAAGSNHRGQCNIANWKDTACFFARADFTVAVTTDGSVLTSVAGHELDWEVLIWK